MHICIFVYAASRLGETYLSLKQAEKKWGILSFDPKTFKTQSEIKKGAMAADLLKSKKYIKYYLRDVAKEIGDPDSFFLVIQLWHMKSLRLKKIKNSGRLFLYRTKT